MPQLPPYDEAKLILQLAQGDEQAFADIFNYYYPCLVSFVVKITKTKHTAEEIVQEVFLRLWKRRSEFKQTNYLNSWLYKVASNLAFDFLKKAAQENKLINYYQNRINDYHDNSLELEFKEKQAIVYNVISNLPPQQKLIYKLSRDEGLSHQQIADKLHISPNTVKNHLVKALQAIRNVLNNTAHSLFSLF